MIDNGRLDLPAGSIITFVRESNVKNISTFALKGEEIFCYHWRLVEIDENGNTIRTYKEGDKLDGGTLVNDNKTIDSSIALRDSYTKETGCTAYTENGLEIDYTLWLERAVLRLRDEREKNPGLWDDAPYGANVMTVGWHRNINGNSICVGSKVYQRTIKSTAQIIAEELTDKKEVQELIVEGIERSKEEDG